MKLLLTITTVLILLAASRPSFADQQVFSPGLLNLQPNAPIALSGFNLVLQSDGNFVGYAQGIPVWSTNTFADCSASCVAAFQLDGNFVLYQNGKPYWSSHTYNHPASQLLVSTQAPYVEVVEGTSIVWPAGVVAAAPVVPAATTCATLNCYYIDSVSGSDAYAGTTIATPWKSLASISRVALTPGTSILLKRGSQFVGQQLTLTASGTAGSPITIDAYGSGALPIITGATYGVFGQGISYINIADLSIANVSGSGILGAGNGTEYWTVTNCTISGAAISGIQVRPDWTNTALLRGWTITGNTIGVINAPPILNYDTSGILVQGTVGATVTKNTVATINTSGIRVQSYQTAQSQNATVSYNEVTQSQGGIAIRSTLNATITHNWVHDGKGYGIGIGGLLDAQGNYTSYNNILTYNLIQNLTPSSDGTLYNGFDINSSSTGKLFHNTIENVAAHTVTLEGDFAPSNNWVIRNNILDSRREGASQDNNPVLFRLVSYPSEVLSNNLYMSDLNWIGIIGTDMDATADLAIWYQPAWLALGIDNNSLYNQDPLFNSVTAENLGIGAASPARNLGATIPGIGQVSLDAGALPYGQTSVLAF
ncbi:right-handed parallel beta-helix repeat-containing protein [Granulicella arctica]|uniref:right-handed parallel beta-helix repeat-containing protein n=1 Tax=Granulicella arctica TaxID=940613 RepID=UPI0021DF4D2B|nr:right-handed parallel beta-helix repeat-containing protein [Granulicella arctica]